MRLTDADFFNNFDYSCFDGPLSEDAIQGMNTVLDLIDKSPTIDAVEVVRCKDCVYGQCEPIKMGTRVCEYYDFIVRNDYDFCSRGERRNDNAAD